MRAHHTQARDMSMWNPIRGFLLHLSEDIAHHLGIFFRSPAADAAGFMLSIAVFGPHDGDEAQLRPCQGMVEVVFQKVVLGQVGNVAGLDGREEVDV